MMEMLGFGFVILTNPRKDLATVLPVAFHRRLRLDKNPNFFRHNYFDAERKV